MQLLSPLQGHYLVRFRLVRPKVEGSFKKLEVKRSGGSFNSYNIGSINMNKTLLGLILAGLIFLIPFTSIASQGLPDRYDPGRDPQQDLEKAISVANNKKILLIIGGDWCNWCLILDNFLKENPDLHNDLNNNFVIVKVHYSQEKDNSEFLKKFPEITVYPHFIILRNDGSYIGEQKTELLESGESYSKKSFEEFINYWRWR